MVAQTVVSVHGLNLSVDLRFVAYGVDLVEKWLAVQLIRLERSLVVAAPESMIEGL